MNERIKQLAQQAVFYDKDEESWEFDREKFAELIIRECICQCYDADSQQYIMSHFGLSEKDWS